MPPDSLLQQSSRSVLVVPGFLVQLEKTSRSQDLGNALAGKSTLNRLELTPAETSREARYKKIAVDEERVEEFFWKVFVQAHPQAPQSWFSTWTPPMIRCIEADLFLLLRD